MNIVNGRSILVVDDDAAMLRALNKVLSGEGANVSKASRTEEALKQLADQRNRFDLIITDLRVPSAGGESILNAARLALPEVPVIIMTAYGNPDLRIQCLSRGAAAFLEKPVAASDLLSRVARVLWSCEKVPLATKTAEETE